MDDIKKIGYRPELKYTDEYTANINFNVESDVEELTDDKTEIDDLIDLGDSLQNMIDSLPDFLGDIIKDPVDPIIDFVKDELNNKVLERVPVELDWTYKNPIVEFPSDEEDEDNDWDEESDPWGEDDDIPIKIENHTKTEIIEKEYVKNLYDLFNDYYTNLHGIVSNFYAGFLYSIMNKETNEIKTIMDNILLNSSDVDNNKLHLLDSSIKSEVYRDMKLRYFSNNFDAEGSLRQTKNFKAVYELRLRYSKVNKNDKPITRSDQMSNNILDAMSVSYDNKYDSSYEQLHRYLKSSNAILEDVLQTAMQSIRSKQTLIETKGVK